MLCRRLAAALMMWACTFAGWAQIPVAQVVDMAGEVRAADGDSFRLLAQGASIFEGTIVRSSPGSRATLKFSDGAVLILGPSTEAAVTKYGLTEAGEMGLNLAQGVFRFVSGAIGKARPDKVRIQMPVVTVGIRGTHFGAEVGADSATIVLLEQPGGGTNAIDVSNEFGSVSIDEPGFGTHIPDARSPPSPPQRLRLQSVERLARNLVRTPAIR
jgi:hypothetical protein